MLSLLGLDKCYSTYESINGDLQHLCNDFTLCEKGCIYGAKAVGTAVRCDREVRLQHLSFSCCIFNLWGHGYSVLPVRNVPSNCPLMCQVVLLTLPVG